MQDMVASVYFLLFFVELFFRYPSMAGTGIVLYSRELGFLGEFPGLGTGWSISG